MPSESPAAQLPRSYLFSISQERNIEVLEALHFHPQVVIGASGLRTGLPVVIYVAKDGPAPDPKAAAAPYTVVDVLDSELAAVADGLGLPS